MTGGDERLPAAVAAGVLPWEEVHRALLDSIVTVARAIFGARASSIMLHDVETDELVFEAVAGEGAETLVGTRFPASRGIAGWVLAADQPLILEDLGADPRFAREVAERTGYVPSGLMAVPLGHEERPIGVLQVLDRPQDARFTLAEADLLALFAHQAALALALAQRARRARAALEGESGELARLARLAAVLDGLEGERREAAGPRCRRTRSPPCCAACRCGAGRAGSSCS